MIQHLRKQIDMMEMQRFSIQFQTKTANYFD